MLAYPYPVGRSTRSFAPTAVRGFSRKRWSGVKLQSLEKPWANATNPTRQRMLSFLGLAEFERSLIAARTSDSRERAREEGGRSAADRSFRRIKEGLL